MDRNYSGGWVYIMADRYRGTMYVGSTADLPDRISLHRTGNGSHFCARYGLKRLVWAERFESMQSALDQEKRIKRWKREWKFELIEKANPDWEDLYPTLV